VDQLRRVLEIAVDHHLRARGGVEASVAIGCPQLLGETSIFTRVWRPRPDWSDFPDSVVQHLPSPP
jgi:hypothetical protein